MIDADIHPLASQELEDAADFYEEQSPGLGPRFLNSVQKAIEQILLFPQSASLIGKTLRQKPLSHFPYSLIYTLDGRRLFIVAIAHQKRESTYWKDRVSN